MNPFLNPFDDHGTPRAKRVWKYWPIRFGWNQYDIPTSFVFWHGWPIDGSSIWAEEPWLEYGWTLHIGALKIYFGG